MEKWEKPGQGAPVRLAAFIKNRILVQDTFSNYLPWLSRFVLLPAVKRTGDEGQGEKRAAGQDDHRAGRQIQKIGQQQPGHDGELGDSHRPPGQGLERAAEQTGGGDRDDQDGADQDDPQYADAQHQRAGQHEVKKQLVEIGVDSGHVGHLPVQGQQGELALVAEDEGHDHDGHDDDQGEVLAADGQDVAEKIADQLGLVALAQADQHDAQGHAAGEQDADDGVAGEAALFFEPVDQGGQYHAEEQGGDQRAEAGQQPDGGAGQGGMGDAVAEKSHFAQGDENAHVGQENPQDQAGQDGPLHERELQHLSHGAPCRREGNRGRGPAARRCRHRVFSSPPRSKPSGFPRGRSGHGSGR
jgi:hypothetical protein